MTLTESIYQNKILINVPLGFTDLSARKLELDRITDGDPREMQELYSVLSDEFAAMNCPAMAAVCLRRADQWRGMVRTA
jgi:hypothetical protein